MLNAFSTDTQYTHALSGTQAEHHLAQDTAGLAEYTRQAAGQLEPETHLCECCEWARGCVKTPRGSRLLQIVQFDIVILKPDNPSLLHYWMTSRLRLMVSLKSRQRLLDFGLQGTLVVNERDEL